MLNRTRLTRLAAVLLGATALLFAIASTAERSSARKEPVSVSSGGASAPAESVAETTSESSHEAAEKSAPTGAAHTAEKSDLRFLGINLEAVGFIVVGTLLSVALGAFVAMMPGLPSLAGAAVFSAGFAILDVVEAQHQVHEARNGLATAAWVLFAGHLGIVLAVIAWTAQRTEAVPVGN